MEAFLTAWQAVGDHGTPSVGGIAKSLHICSLSWLNSIASLPFPSGSGAHPQQAKSLDCWHLEQRNGSFLTLLFYNSFPTSRLLAVLTKAREREL